MDIPDAELLDKLELLVDGKLTHAGALCFYRNPQKVIGGCYAKIGKFEGGELLYQDEVTGSLIIIADRSIELIYLKYLKARVSYYKETRVETYPYARDAVREAVYNALIHCNWTDNNPVQIRIHEDKMYISNSSMLPFDLTAEKLMAAHTSRPHNPSIANVFYRAGYIERWGRGIQKICDACRNLGADDPIYRVYIEDIMVEFNALQSAIVDDDKVPKYQSTVDFGALEDALVQRIIDVLQVSPEISQEGLADELGTTRCVIQKKITILKNMGKIERVGGKRYGHWEIK